MAYNQLVRKWLHRAQAGEPEFSSTWQTMKKESRRQFRSPLKCVKAVQLQMISFDSITVWLRYELIICIWRGCACCNAPACAVSSVPAGARQQPCSALLLLPNSLPSALHHPIYTDTQPCTGHPGSPSYASCETGIKRRNQGVSQSCGTAPAQQAPLFKRAKCKRAKQKQPLGNQLWTGEGQLPNHGPQLEVALDFPGFHWEQRS